MRCALNSHWTSVAVLAVLAAMPLGALAGKPGGSTSATALKAYVYSTFVDEHDTIAFNGGDTSMCNGTDLHDVETARFGPDGGAAYTGAWNVPGWDEMSNPSVLYEDGKDCGAACLRAQFISSDKVLTIDTNKTPRTLSLDFGYPFDPSMNPWVEPDPSMPAEGSPLGPRVLNVAGLFEVLGAPGSLKDMKVCTTRACPEATQQTYARYWFADPANPDVSWRLNWNFTRVLRVSPDVWYFIDGACDGSRSAGLSKLSGNRTRPRETNMGWYLMPLFIAVQIK